VPPSRCHAALHHSDCRKIVIFIALLPASRPEFLHLAGCSRYGDR
jgi:hypothetical protein